MWYCHTPPKGQKKGKHHGSSFRAEQQKFQDDGYLIFNPEIDKSIIDDLVADLDNQYTRFQDDNGKVLSTRLTDHWPLNKGVHHLAVAPKILNVLRDLYKREPRPFQTLNFPVGTEQRIHSDSIHFNSIPPTYMCGVWIALEDCDMDNGPLIFYPRSHRLLPEYTLDSFMKPDPLQNYSSLDAFFTKHYPSYEDFLVGAIKDFNLEPKYGTIKKGEALLWSSNLPHGGTPRKDPERTRNSQVTHYFFENCTYYTPMFSQGTKLLLREPNFIPKQSPLAPAAS